MMEEMEKPRCESNSSVKTVLHFSDGVLEITEPDTETAVVVEKVECDPKTLDWGPWTMHMTMKAGSKTLEVCDYLGESLASFFGITTPKYYFEINEYHRIQKEKEDAQKEKDLEMGGWAQGDDKSQAIMEPPHSITNKEEAIRY